MVPRVPGMQGGVPREATRVPYQPGSMTNLAPYRQSQAPYRQSQARSRTNMVRSRTNMVQNWVQNGPELGPGKE